jgi:hypothetical protein
MKDQEEIERIFSDSIKSTREWNEEFFMNPDKYLKIGDIGDLHLEWFNARYAYLRMMEYMPLFDRAYKLLTERKHFSRKNAFGEMHGDGCLWIEKADNVQVIIEERQSYRRAYIKSETRFHIRALSYQWNCPSWRRTMLLGCTIKKMKNQGFKPTVDYKNGAPNFLYGDSRDVGYILSMELDWQSKFLDECLGAEKAGTIPSMKKGIDSFCDYTIGGITCIKFWEVYLDDPKLLE